MKVDKSFTFDHTLETLDGNLWKALLKCKKLLYLRILNVSFNRQPLYEAIHRSFKPFFNTWPV